VPGKRARRVRREAARKRPGFIQHEHGTSLGSPPYVYGFRPGRCCQDAAESLYATLKGKSKRTWILDADLTAAFDKISHSFLLARLGTFPARDMIAGWLKAGVFETGKGFAPTEEGTPQGALCSAEHKPPYEQCRVMRSAGPPALVGAGSASEH
jgi:Reverse transcriptase (RNA-dependent DNA polymerase)